MCVTERHNFCCVCIMLFCHSVVAMWSHASDRRKGGLSNSTAVLNSVENLHHENSMYSEGSLGGMASSLGAETLPSAVMVFQPSNSSLQANK